LQRISHIPEKSVAPSTEDKKIVVDLKMPAGPIVEPLANLNQTHVLKKITTSTKCAENSLNTSSSWSGATKNTQQSPKSQACCEDDNIQIIACNMKNILQQRTLHFRAI